MSEAWKTYPAAPREGSPLCTVAEVPEEGVLSLVLNGFPLLLVRSEGLLKAYVNACPHQYLPLDHRGRNVLSADKTTLRCSNHGAGFSAATGEGVEGLGLGSCLDPVPVVVVDEDVRVMRSGS